MDAAGDAGPGFGVADDPAGGVAGRDRACAGQALAGFERDVRDLAGSGIDLIQRAFAPRIDLNGVEVALAARLNAGCGIGIFNATGRRAGALAAACDAAQDKVLSLAEPGGRGPASTLVLAVVTEDVVSVAWLGDSPACIVRGAEVIVLTEPHADESGAITAFLGHPGRPACSFECCVLQPGDALLIMSDGVSGVLDPENLIRLVSETEPADLARVLVDEAVLLGSQDNCTAACLVLPDPASAVIAEDGPDVFESAVPVDPPSRIRRFVLEATLREFAVESDKECVPC